MLTRRRLLAAGAVVLLLGVAIGIYAYDKSQPVEKRGSAKEEFDPGAIAKRRPPEDPRPWPQYAYDAERDHVSPYRHRPPYRRLWQINAHDTVEFPPSVGYGTVFVPQQRGLFLALDARTGRVRWRKNLRRCAAASPAIGRRIVYQAYMDFSPCPQDRPGATGYVIAWNVKTGKRVWKFNAAPVESSPLLVGRTLYFGSWDHRLYAVDARTGRKKWSFQTDEQVNTSPAYWRGTIYVATDAGSVYAVGARSGRQRWRAQSHGGLRGREFFYATPTIAYGRVYIGNTDGTMYVYGAKTGRLRWARPLGSYIYSAAAVWKRRVFVGTYDGAAYALDAATGDVRWKISAPGAIHAAPTVMSGLVYFATCSSCGSAASRAVKHGPDGTFAVRARNGRRVWGFEAGKYANPVVADSKRVYVTGRAAVFALEPRSARRAGRRRHSR